MNRTVWTSSFPVGQAGSLMSLSGISLLNARAGSDKYIALDPSPEDTANGCYWRSKTIVVVPPFPLSIVCTWVSVLPSDERVKRSSFSRLP